ncbi:ABC transporter ATP-binding protein [Actinocorallia lasiicapitis]
MPVLTITGLTCRLGERTLLDGVDLAVETGRSIAVTGPSGSGKSTLLGCVLGLIAADEGSIVIAGVETARLGSRRMAAVRRRHLGVVFQFGELLPELTPVENVALPALLSGVPQRVANDRARELLDALGVPFGSTPTAHLSGGERQRAAVARALVSGPDVLLADEPTGALDAETRDSVADILFSAPAEHRCGLVVVTHDPQVAARADRVVELSGGRLRETVR